MKIKMLTVRRLCVSSKSLQIARNLLFAFVITNNQLLHVKGSSDFKNIRCSSSNSGSCQGNSIMSEEVYTPGEASAVFVTTPDINSAKKIAHGIVEQKLAACVNIIPQIQSIYMWEGKVNEDNELLLMIKTRSERVEELSKWVRDNHPYSVAEVIALPIEQGNAPYLKWIKEVVPNKKQ